MTLNSKKNLYFNHPIVAAAQKCGYLVKEKDSYIIKDCGNVLTISYNDIQTFSKHNIENLESASAKYEKIKNIEIPFKKQDKQMKIAGQDRLKNIARYDETSSNYGQLVFTGKIYDKKNEFVFKKNGQSLNLKDAKVFDSFKKIYLDNKNSTDGQYWEKKLNTSEIPIFYITDNENKVTSIGLTQLFKLPYNKTLLNAAKQISDDAKLDLAETIFGTLKENFELKGRVQFSHCKSNTVSFYGNKEEVLGSPNPTYYPNYIRQTETNGNHVNRYITLMDTDAQISGWKRYPLQEKPRSYPLPKKEDGLDNHEVATKFKPLDKGTTFEGKIRFHNLRKAEIGALLSAISFHGRGTTHMHNIGMAKSLGYGKISMKPTLHKSLKYSWQEYLDTFEKMMTAEIPQWEASAQLTELFAMADIKCKDTDKLKYQLLENPSPNPKYKSEGKDEVNDFVGAKKNKEYLNTHTGNVYITAQQMKNACEATWLNVFKIAFIPEDIKLFNSNKTKGIQDQNRQSVYAKLQTSNKMKYYCNYIEKFFNFTLDETDKIKLYQAISNLS